LSQGARLLIRVTGLNDSVAVRILAMRDYQPIEDCRIIHNRHAKGDLDAVRRISRIRRYVVSGRRFDLVSPRLLESVNHVFFNRLFGVAAVTRPNIVPGVPVYLDDPAVAGRRRINRSAFIAPPPNQQGAVGRNSLRGFPVTQLDFSLRRQFKFTERYKLQLRGDLFNVFNHPNFGDPDSLFESPTFGDSVQMLGKSLGSGGIETGFSPLYQIGGPRSIQLALKLQF
jgi:hypothetical protein